jgi:hypothetical protein
MTDRRGADSGEGEGEEEEEEEIRGRRAGAIGGEECRDCRAWGVARLSCWGGHGK